MTSEEVVKITEDKTLYAGASINYTLTFSFNNGTENEVRALDFNAAIVYPENTTKDRYTFDKWDSSATTMPAHDLTITAQWVASVVTIVFGTKDFKEVEDKIREIIGSGENVIIEFIANEENSTITCIIKFVDQISDESITSIMENPSNAPKSTGRSGAPKTVPPSPS